VAIERTFAIIKPGRPWVAACREKFSRAIHKAGFKICGPPSRCRLDEKRRRAGFLRRSQSADHFSASLPNFMSSGKIFCAGAGKPTAPLPKWRGHDGRHRSQKKRRRGLFATTLGTNNRQQLHARVGRARTTAGV